MTAPSLILLGHGSNDPQVPQVSHQIREGLLAIRPELDIHVAFLDHCTPSGIQVVNKLVSRGVEEIVFVPLLLSDAFHVQADVPALLAQVRASFPELRVLPPVPLGQRRSCCRSSIGGFVTRCALGMSRSWMGWSSRPPEAATSGAMRWSHDGPGNGRHITGCPA